MTTTTRKGNEHVPEVDPKCLLPRLVTGETACALLRAEVIPPQHDRKPTQERFAQVKLESILCVASLICTLMFSPDHVSVANLIPCVSVATSLTKPWKCFCDWDLHCHGLVTRLICISLVGSEPLIKPRLELKNVLLSPNDV